MDSGTATYQLKALSNEDFDRWMAVIRKYVNQSKERQLLDPDYPMNLTSPRQSLDRRQSIYRRQSTYERRQSLLRGDPFRVSRIDNGDDVSKIYEIFSNMDKNFRDVKDILENLRNITDPLSPSPYGRVPTNSDGKFKIKKFPISLQKATSPTTETNQPPSPSPFNMSLEHIYDKLYTAFSELKTEKDKVLDLFRVEADKWATIETAYRKFVGESDNLRKTDTSKFPIENGPSEIDEKSSISESGNQSERALSLNSVTTNSEVFFDAEDIVLSADALTEESDIDTAIVEVIDEESEEEILEHNKTEEIEIPVPTPDDHALTRTISFRRRKLLPSPICGDDVSLFSILRKNVGKDLATIAMPISLNEPLNLLQRMTEELEYSELLDKAANETSSFNRLMLVSAFAVSGYASTQNRAGRKPFNPLHGETYECIRPDKGFKYIAEKVSHYPPIMACYAESSNWKFWQDSKIKSKFWGKSMELTPSGTVHISIGNDHFTYTKPTTWMRNMISGNKYLEHTGVMKIQNQTTGEACEMTFNQSGFFSSGPQNEVVGKLFSANGKKVGTIVGRWNEILFNEIGPNQLEVIWKANPLIPDYDQYYGFTQFTIELNEITPDIEDFLPNTDTRFRPDQRLFEEGHVEEAEQEKLRVEQKQRDFRKQLEKNGQTWQPQWFKLVNDEWIYNGLYFETREKKAFKKNIELW